jgi:hypothetical protein
VTLPTVVSLASVIDNARARGRDRADETFHSTLNVLSALALALASKSLTVVTYDR